MHAKYSSSLVRQAQGSSVRFGRGSIHLAKILRVLTRHLLMRARKDRPMHESKLSTISKQRRVQFCLKLEELTERWFSERDRLAPELTIPISLAREAVGIFRVVGAFLPAR